MEPKGAWRLALPLALAQVLFFLAPLLILAATSLATDENLSAVSGQAWAEVLGDSFNLGAAWNTLRLGAMTVLATTVLAVPLALLHLAAGPGLKKLILLAAVLPLLTSVVVRTFAWIAILGREGVINNALIATGLATAPVPLLQTEHGLILALTQIEMPLMLLPLIAAMARIDPVLLDASAALGASLLRTLRRVVLPIALPGLLAGATLVFASAATAFISQSVIGGGRLAYLPYLVWQQAMVVFNWPLAAALALTLMASVLAVVTALSALGRKVAHV
ncbi:ABC transporter permease [Muricoccus pecuniae]|uniref:Putative spermidine/putrescine transport system permease protein n=1 Tax=Muricoccus pecuniae TaxID=693023 RepID=A0A840YN69_9PROT|nr:ABC transporter permease [Roseomonas pecuniae]MBB5696324.1 putative spermidine/putrescine transport system permease protein [Roseomonas pecuniae]